MPAEVRVVIVEDEEEICHLLQELLILEGYEAVVVRHPRDALSVAKDADPALFFIDVMLPGTSGIEVAQELREHNFSGTPMIAMSASQIMVRVATESRLFQAVVEKPFDFDALFAEVGRLLEA
jgi:DNA-binding response OmpR family regulator